METFRLNSGLLVVTDPSHLDVKNGIVFNSKKGLWNCFVESEDRFSNKFINKLIIKSDSIDESEYALAMAMLIGKTDLFEQTDSTIKAESGQIGVFDTIYYRNNDSLEGCERISEKIVCEDDLWYSFCCDRSLSKNKWGVIPFGCLCSVAFDGFYKVSSFTNNSGVVVKVEIDFSQTVEQINKLDN